jgi:hypothetical protein
MRPIERESVFMVDSVGIVTNRTPVVYGYARYGIILEAGPAN